MAGMGPPPKPSGTRARRNPSIALTTLPTKGRGRRRAPKWPLQADVILEVKKRLAEETVERLRDELNDCDDTRSVRRLEREIDKALMAASILEAQLEQQAASELLLWRQLWATPQAAMWEQLAWSREVAQYVRWKVRGEMGDLDAAKEARQWSDRLGLNPLAMLRLRWEIERADDAENRGETRRKRQAAAAAAASTQATQSPGEDPRSILHAVK